jgi:hypothetical protein
MALTLEYLQMALRIPTLLAYMNNFEPVGAKVKSTALFYHKNYNNKTYKNVLTTYDDKKYGKMDRANFCFTLSLC